MFPQPATILVAYPEQIRCIAVSSLTALLCTRRHTCVAIPRNEKRMTGVDEKLGSIGGCTSRTRSTVKRYRRTARAAHLRSKEMSHSADDRIPVPACRQRPLARLLNTFLHRLHAVSCCSCLWWLGPTLPLLCRCGSKAPGSLLRMHDVALEALGRATLRRSVLRQVAAA